MASEGIPLWSCVCKKKISQNLTFLKRSRYLLVEDSIKCYYDDKK